MPASGRKQPLTNDRFQQKKGRIYFQSNKIVPFGFFAQLLRDKLDVARFPTSSRTRQPTPDERQSGPPCVINTYRASRPAGKNLTLRRQALIKKLDAIGTCHAPDLITHANPATLVSAPDGISLDVVMKHRACAGQPLGVARYCESAIVQTLADLRKANFHKCRVL
jgi:hypothetical protein